MPDVYIFLSLCLRMSEVQPILIIEAEADEVLPVSWAFRKASINHPLISVREGEAAINYSSGDGKHADRQQSPLPVLVLLDLKMPGAMGSK